MNFFEQQRRARHQTALLIVLMIIAVLCLIALTSMPFIIGVFDGQHDSEAKSKALHTTGVVAMIVSGIVLLGSLFKFFQLLGGGKVIAEKLGGRPINDNMRTPDERRLMNVVEEMALASGVTVPAVYLLPDETINAFAAGFNPKDAVIGVTQGAMSLLTREELQGVIAHEFSHIYNGDMLLNTRLVATVHGILVVGLTGAYLLFGLTKSKKSKKKDDEYFWLLVGMSMGVVLCVAGFIGSFFANVIKAAVSRQREFLADASAVQFTRNPQGIAGALKKIGSQGSTLSSPRAKEFSHLYFSAGSKTFFKSLFATHPDLSERIRRIDPQWDGQFTEPPAQ